MRKVRDVLRLRHTLGMSFRQISEATGVGKTVVGEYVRRAGVIGITWPLPEEIDDAELERRLFPVPGETAAPRVGKQSRASAYAALVAARVPVFQCDASDIGSWIIVPLSKERLSRINRSTDLQRFSASSSPIGDVAWACSSLPRSHCSARKTVANGLAVTFNSPP